MESGSRPHGAITAAPRLHASAASAIQRYIFEKRERAARLERMSPDQFISMEIDPILEKISREGLHSLTRAERKILAQGRDKIAAKRKSK